MLVLSRREDQKILFPNLGITVEVLGIKGKNVRLGIEAPRDIRVIRSELAEPESVEETFSSTAARLEQQLENVADARIRQAMRARLNSAANAIQTAQQQLQSGSSAEAEAILQDVIHSLRELDGQLTVENGVVAGIRIVTKWKALLVEDDANERALMAGILRMNGFDVDSVSDGVEAIEYLEENEPPDVVLMDMMMPRLDGPKTISAIRSQTRLAGLKIFGVSGMELNETCIPLGADGVTGWFQKPVDPTQMVRSLRDQIEKLDALEKAASIAG